MNIDLVKNEQTKDEPLLGLCGFISWRRLVEQLRTTGEFKNDEAVVELHIDARGIQYRLKPGTIHVDQALAR